MEGRASVTRPLWTLLILTVYYEVAAAFFGHPRQWRADRNSSPLNTTDTNCLLWGSHRFLWTPRAMEGRASVTRPLWTLLILTVYYEVAAAFFGHPRQWRAEHHNSSPLNTTDTNCLLWGSHRFLWTPRAMEGRASVTRPLWTLLILTVYYEGAAALISSKHYWY